MEIVTAGSTLSNGGLTEEARQAEHVRALLEELDKCTRAGRWDRVDAIRAELGKKARSAKTPAQRAEARPSVYEGRRTQR